MTIAEEKCEANRLDEISDDVCCYSEEPFLNPNTEKEAESNTSQESAVLRMTIAEDKCEANRLDELSDDLTPNATQEVGPNDIQLEVAVDGLPPPNANQNVPVVKDGDADKFLDGDVFKFQVNEDVYQLLCGFKAKAELFDHLKRNRVGFYKIIGLKKGRQIVNFSRKIDGRLDGGGKRSSIYGEFFC